MNLVLAALKNPNNDLYVQVCAGLIATVWIISIVLMARRQQLLLVMVGNVVFGLLCTAYVLLSGMEVVPGLEDAWILIPCGGAFFSFVLGGAARLLRLEAKEDRERIMASRSQRGDERPLD